MNKTKQTLLSMLVFFTVFCVTVIINIPATHFIQNGSDSKQEDTANHSIVDESKDTLSAKSEVMLEETADTGVRSFSYAIEEDQVQAEANTSVSEGDAVSTQEIASLSEKSTEATSEVLNEASPLPEPEAVYANIGISIANSYVNIRKEASTDSSVLGKLYRDSAVEILESKGDWYYVESGSVNGYVKSEYVKKGIPDDELIEKYGVLSISVAVDGLNVRIEPSMESKKLTVIYKNEVYPVVETEGDWYEIKIPDENITGYVKSEHATLLVDFKKAVSKEEELKLLQLEAEERAKKETEIKHHNGVSYSAEDLKLLACLVHAEAGTQSYEGKLAVANVVLNRVKHSGDSIKDVIYAPGQFSVASSGSLAKQLSNYGNYSSKAQLMSIKAAKDALEGDNNIGSRRYFHSYKAAVREGHDDNSNAVKIDDQLFW